MRYIDPYQLTDKVIESMRDNPHEGKIALNHRLEHEHFLRMIALAPDADVEPVIHARWIKNTKMCRADGHIYDYCCSACGGFAQKGCYNNYDRLTPYCAECGAEMELEVRE